MSGQVFSIPVGSDFAQTFVAGLETRFGHLPPEAFARIVIYVNTRRMQRRLREVFDAGPPRLLPQVRLITDLSDLDPEPEPRPIGLSLSHRLQLSQLIGGLLEADSTLAPKSARFDLADSLVSLLAEIAGEGVSMDAIRDLDVSDESGHWERALSFLKLVQDYQSAAVEELGGEARQRRIVDRLTEAWAGSPPADPIIVAGSTGSRGTTAAFMELVARQPVGAVVLPGVDQVMPRDIWDVMVSDEGGEDHPQYRFKAFCDRLDLHPADLKPWEGACEATPRERLVSLSLRPAPVTDQWITQGPKIGPLGPATESLSLIEAPSPRHEADAIAVRIRQAIEAGKVAALVTPDRTLSRRVASALGRWGITPDDSAGTPLHLSPPGRLMRQVARMLAAPLEIEGILSILKHPLCNSGEARGKHLLWTSLLEKRLRRSGPPVPDGPGIRGWAEKAGQEKPGLSAWGHWLAGVLETARHDTPATIEALAARHLALGETLAMGPEGEAAGQLWAKAAGRLTRAALAELAACSDAAGPISAQDYVILLDKQLAAKEVRDRDTGHPQALIWGTLEARVQIPDVMILGGMNEGTWPEQPAPDPWLNRRMRKSLGLLLPERRIGLAAHDYQLAMSAPEVVIARATRSADAETVPSRWVNRLCNLLGGLTNTGGPESLAAMRTRGDDLLRIARMYETPDAGEAVAPAPRPSPIVPTDARPRQLSVTRIKTLIRDPYAIYARYVLGLRKLDPLSQSADAPLRGTILHKVLERFLQQDPKPADPAARKILMQTAQETLSELCPWPAAQRFWLAKVDRFADQFLSDEVRRQALADKRLLEVRGLATLDDIDFTLTAEADRIDIAPDGSVLIYDYKTGTAPATNQQKYFDKQLLLEAAMAEHGAFDGLEPVPVSSAAFLQLSSDVKTVPAPLSDPPIAEFWAEFTALMQRWAAEEIGYTSRRSNMSLSDRGDYDHLARYGEWDEGSTPEKQVL